MKHPLKITLNTAQKRNKKLSKAVENEAEAKAACLNKWNLVAAFTSELENLADSSCGFCYLSIKRKVNTPSIPKCETCPSTIEKYCQPMLPEINALWRELINTITQTITFLENYEPQGEVET